MKVRVSSAYNRKAHCLSLMSSRIACALLTLMPESHPAPLRCVIIDDDRIVGMLHRMVLVRAGFCASPIVCEKGSEGLRHLLEHQPERVASLVFLDLHMPQMTGWEILDALEKHTLDAPVYVVIVSSSVDPADIARAQHYPMVINFLSKPLTTKRLDELRSHPALTAYFAG